MTGLPDFRPSDLRRFEAALRRFDEENSRDPNVDISDGQAKPRELAYSIWLTDRVLKLAPSASEELRLAARCQHICRWMMPRQAYPMTRPGYLKWREELKKFHAQKAGKILREVGYPDETISRVQTLNLKKEFPRDPESRILEDALCLVFLELQFAELADKTDRDTMINVLRKSWGKMSPAGQAMARTLSFPEREKALLEAALSAKD
jgi:hypothetical protein